MKNKTKPVKKTPAKKKTKNNVSEMISKFAPTEGFRVLKTTDIKKSNLVVNYEIKGDIVLLNKVYNCIYNDIAESDHIIFDVMSVNNKNGETSSFIIIKDLFRYHNLSNGFDEIVQQFPLFMMDFVMDNQIQIELNFFDTALHVNDAYIIESIEDYLSNISNNQAKIISDDKALRNKLINTPFEI